MAPPTMRLNSVLLWATDVVKSANFYKTLGCLPLEEPIESFARVQLPSLAPATTIAIHKVEATMPPKLTCDIYIELDSDEALLEKLEDLKGKGIKLESDIIDQPWGYKEARVKDPAGNVVVLYHGMFRSLTHLGVPFIPDKYNAVIPYLIVRDAGKLFSFIEKVFDGEAVSKISNKAGVISHASIRVHGSTIMLGNIQPGSEPTPGGLYVYVPNCDETYKKGLAEGAISIMEPSDMFYGDRNCGFKDYEGNTWWIGTHQQHIPEEELQKMTVEHEEQREAAANSK